jgi:negative regulator of flagellin synthesis FlgM
MPSVELSKLQGIAAARAVATSERAQIETRAAAPRSSAAPAPAPGVSVEIGDAASAASAPVDAERVREVRAALKDGTYPLVPAKIVDAIIAAQVSFALPAKE